MKVIINRIFSLGLAFLLVLSPQGAVRLSAQDEGGETGAPASLDQITIQGNVVSLKTTKPAAFNVVRLGSPERLVIDLADTRNNWAKRSVTLKNNAVFRRIRSSQFKTQPLTTRVVIELKGPVEYESSSEGSVIKLSASNSNDTATETMAAAPTPSEMVESAPGSTEETAPAEAAEPAVAALAAPAAVKEETASKPAAQDPVPQAAQAAEPVKKEPALSEAEKVALTALPSDPSSLFGRQSVTLDFYDIGVRELFKLMGEKSGVNIVYGSEVTGSVSIQLRDVAFKDAVDTVLALTNLKMIAMGKNIVQVMTPAEFDKYRTSAISTTRLFPINYASASNVNTQLSTILTTLGGKGKTLVDERTNSIIVTDTPEGIEKTAKLIADLDKPAPQVMIEAKIVQVSLGKSVDLGITWGVAYTDQSGNQMISIGASKAQTTPDPSPGSGGSAGLQTQTALNPSGGSGLELGGAGFSPAQGLGLTFGFVKDVVRLNAALSALQQKNKSKLLSNPKIATLNNQAATIQSQVSEPYLTTQTQLTNAGTLSTQVVSQSVSGISLSVTPTINADGRITIKINPNITSSQPTAIGVPKTTSQTANTTVIVKDGETFVIGGLINEQEGDNKSYIPVLGSIPLLGHLFKKTTVSKSRAELLVFVTPKIIPY